MNEGETQQSGWALKRVGIVGAGAIGTSLAAIIGERLPTVMVCRNPRRAAELFEHGARMTGVIETASRPIVVSSIADLARVGGVSALFIATKTTAIPAVAEELKPVLATISDSPDGLFVVSYQNGIEPGRQMTALLNYPRVLRMVITFGALLTRGEPAVRSTMNAPPHYIGGIDQSYAHASRAIAAVLSEAGFFTEHAGDIERYVWGKGIVNAATNPVCALVDGSVGEVLASPARLILERLLHEGVSVARTEGINLAPDFLDRAHVVLEAASAHTPSMVEDIRSGAESEVGQLNRQIVAHAHRLSVPAPTHEVIDALIETFDWRLYERRETSA